MVGEVQALSQNRAMWRVGSVFGAILMGFGCSGPGGPIPEPTPEMELAMGALGGVPKEHDAMSNDAMRVLETSSKVPELTAAMARRSRKSLVHLGKGY